MKANSKALKLRLLNRVQMLPWCGCWIWMGAVSTNGYGHIGNTTIHRHSYELFKGPIPANYEVAHIYTCASRACVNPEHLIAMTRAEHMKYDHDHKFKLLAQLKRSQQC